MLAGRHGWDRAGRELLDKEWQVTRERETGDTLLTPQTTSRFVGARAWAAARLTGREKHTPQHSPMTARLAEGGTSWDDMLDAAVRQGLTAAPEEKAAPAQLRLTSGAEDAEDADKAHDANDAEDAEDDLEALHGSLAHEVSVSLQAATARSVTLLRRGPSSPELQAELLARPNPAPHPEPNLHYNLHPNLHPSLHPNAPGSELQAEVEFWLLEGGRMQARRLRSG